MSLPLKVRRLGRQPYAATWEAMSQFTNNRGPDTPDELWLLEHDPVFTQGQAGKAEHVLAPGDIPVVQVDRGGQVTYHGPGQIVGYPILDLREWKRDVVQYVRGIEQAIIDALAQFGIAAGRLDGATGVWTRGAKIAAIGVHISRWVSSHGFALNVDTDLSYFRYIVPCGLTLPVTSMRAQGSMATRAEVTSALAASFGRFFELEITEPTLTERL